MKKLLNKLRNLNKGKRGVSEVVSVLVLTAVVIVGAIGAGVIMTTFSNQVADDTSASGIGQDAASELLIAGSTTVQPLSECLAEAYMEDNKGVRVTVQGGGSGAGVASTGMNIVDIGSASRALKTDEEDKYPKVQTHQVGGSAVVVIASEGCTVTGPVSKDLLAGLYQDGNLTGFNVTTVTEVYQRAEASGTEETFADYILGADDLDSYDAGSLDMKTAVGNAGVLAAVQGATCAIGFVDYGYAADADDIKILDITGYETTGDNIEDALGGDDTYPAKLTRPLNYLTNGDPSTIEDDFLTFARSPGAQACFDETGYIPYFVFA